MRNDKKRHLKTVPPSIPIGTAGGKLVHSGYCPNLAGGRRPVPAGYSTKNSIRYARLVSFEACGHFLFYDQQERFTKELIRFIEE